MKNEVNTTENNKLLAEFMGEKLPYLNEEGNFEFVVKGAGKVSSPNEEDLYRFLPYKYSTDWNWLMQVVEKIESLGINFWVVKNKVNLTIVGELAQKLDNLYNTEFEGYDFEYYKGNTKIEAVYNACVEFVKWYNENTGQEK